MYFYFTGEYKSAIKINGTFYGVLSQAFKTLRIDNGCPLIEICPLEKSGQTINLILDEEFLSSPPNGVSVTNLKGGYLLKFYKKYNDNEFKIITQQKFADCIATLFNENGLKLSIETKDDFYAETFSFNASNAQISRFELNGNKFLCLFFEDNSNLIIYNIGTTTKKVFSREVKEFSTDKSFITTESYKDIAKHQIKTEWAYELGEFVAKNINATFSPNFSIKNLHPKLIPYAFLEALSLGAEWKDYLYSHILENADKLKGFFGEYFGVIPPPTFRKENEVGLVYKIKENLYSVDYYTFETIDNLISNIIKVED